MAKRNKQREKQIPMRRRKERLTKSSIQRRLLANAVPSHKVFGFFRWAKRQGIKVEELNAHATSLIQRVKQGEWHGYSFHPKGVISRGKPPRELSRVEVFRPIQGKNFSIKLHQGWCYFDGVTTVQEPHFVLYDKRGVPIYTIRFFIDYSNGLVEVFHVQRDGIVLSRIREELAKDQETVGLNGLKEISPQDFIFRLFLKQLVELMEKKGYNAKFLFSTSNASANGVYKDLIRKYLKPKKVGDYRYSGQYVLDTAKQALRDFLGEDIKHIVPNK